MRLLDTSPQTPDERLNAFRHLARSYFRACVREWVFSMMAHGCTSKVADEDKLMAELRKLAPKLAPHVERYVRETSDP